MIATIFIFNQFQMNVYHILSVSLPDLYETLTSGPTYHNTSEAILIQAFSSSVSRHESILSYNHLPPATPKCSPHI